MAAPAGLPFVLFYFFLRHLKDKINYPRTVGVPTLKKNSIMNYIII